MLRHICLFPLAFFLYLMAGQAQNGAAANWRPLMSEGLTGAAFKITPVQAHASRFRAGLRGGVSFDPHTAGQLFSTQLWTGLKQGLQEQPEQWEILRTQLGGDVWLGDPSQTGFSNEKTRPVSTLGLQAELSAGRHWALQAGLGRGSYAGSANFPVSILSQHNTGTRQEQGSIRAPVTCWSADLSGRYYLFVRNPVQVFAGMGVQYQRRAAQTGTATLAGLSWPVASGWKSTQYRGLFQGGLSLQPRRWRVYAELGGGAMLPVGGRPEAVSGYVQGALGWRF